MHPNRNITWVTTNNIGTLITIIDICKCNRREAFLYTGMLHDIGRNRNSTNNVSLAYLRR